MLYFTVAELIPKLKDKVLFTLPSAFLRQKESLQGQHAYLGMCWVTTEANTVLGLIKGLWQSLLGYFTSVIR